MGLKGSRKKWDMFGKNDPLWSILTDPDKKSQKWDVDEFFATGKREIGAVMKYLKSLDVIIRQRRALDFGCGIGRLTQALAQYFDEIYGIDGAPSMIELANRYDRHADKCTYYLNEASDLKLFPDNRFDFIYSNITLQHIVPGYAKNYMREFLRVLVPHGVLLFQLPDRPKMSNEAGGINVKGLMLSFIPASLFYSVYRKVMGPFGRSKIEMYCIRRKNVIKLLERNGAKILDIVQDCSAGANWVGYRYCVTKA